MTHNKNIFCCSFRYALTLVWVFVMGVLTAQDMELLKTVMPPSPTASSLGKYADWPVSLYTGVPNISIPVYTAQGRRLSVPMALNYHASGIKVSEIASWIGLGWSLDAGGAITRSVVGLPDDMSGYLWTRSFYTDPGDMSSSMTANASYEHDTFLTRVADGLSDSEPDYYTFSAMGKSYKFFFKGDGSIATVPASNIKITCSNVSTGGSFIYWKVVLEDGTQLLFGNGATEVLYDVQFGNSLNGATIPYTAWYLYKIISVDGEEIKFAYKEESVEQSMSYSETDYAKLYSTTPYKAPTRTTSRPRATAKLLYKIETVTDSVVFETKPRQDLEDGNALQEIKIYSALTGELVKKFLFNHTYSRASSSNVYSTFKDDYEYRLKLIELKEVSPDDSQEKVWSFSYNPILLPSRASFAQDHWGYFNNAIKNKTLLPFHQSFNPVNVAYGNREPDSTAVMGEMLTKIVYPTGGYTEFNFESNRVVEPQDNYKTSGIELDQVNTTKSFHSHKPQVISVFMEALFHDYEDYTGDGSQTNALASLVIKRDGVSVDMLQIKEVDLNTAGTGSVQMDFLLDIGDYTVELTPLTNDIVTNLYVEFQYQEWLGLYTSVRSSGGVRVKSIFDYDPESNKTIKRFFVYENPYEIHAMSLEDYVSDSEFRTYSCGTDNGENGGHGFTYDGYTTRIRFSGLRSALGSIQGGAIGYQKVTTLYGEGGSNGKTVSYFSSAEDDFSQDGTVTPFPPGTDRGYKRGLLERQEEYTAAGVLLKKQVNQYDFVNEKNIKALKVAYKFTKLSSCMFYEFIEQVLIWRFYTIATEQLNQATTTETSYFLNANNTYDSLEVIKNFFYDTPGNMLATRIETTDSQGRLLRTIQRTPLDKVAIQTTMSLPSTASLAIDSLIRQNRISEVLQVETQLDDVLISRQTMLHKIWNEVSSSFVAPEKVLLQLGSNPVETRVLFTKYDANGNLLEQQKSNDVMHAYLYNYAASKPVAEITNAGHDDVAYTSFEAEDPGNWTISSADRNVGSAQTGINSYSLTGGKQITKSGLVASNSYRLTFWARQGDVVLNGTEMLGTAFTANGWTYYEKTITNSSAVILSGTAVIDEVRLFPVGAQMTTYTYDPLVGLTSATDPNNITSYYQYDELGRLKFIKDRDENIVKYYKYHYSGQQSE